MNMKYNKSYTLKPKTTFGREMTGFGLVVLILVSMVVQPWAIMLILGILGFAVGFWSSVGIWLLLALATSRSGVTKE